MNRIIGPFTLAEWMTGLFGGGLAGWALFGAVQVLYSLDVAGYEAVVLPVSEWKWGAAAGLMAAGAALTLFWLYRLREAGCAAPAKSENPSYPPVYSGRCCWCRSRNGGSDGGKPLL